MEETITPFNEISNSKENLIYPEEPEEQDNQEIYNVNQFFVDVKFPEKDDKFIMTSERDKFIFTFNCCRVLIIVFTTIILSITIFLASGISSLKTGDRIIIILEGIILVLIILIFSKNRLEITKDKSNNKAIIKIKNFLCFTIKTIKIDLDSIYFHIKHETFTDSEGYTQVSNGLIIINNNKNLLEIDLDKSNIKSKPANVFYYFKDIGFGKYEYEQLNDDLNKFVGASGDKDTSELFLSDDLGGCMKLSDNYFTFYFRDPLSTSCFNRLFIFLTILSNLIFINLGGFFFISLGVNNDRYKEKGYIVIGALLFVIPNVILYLIYKCIKVKSKEIFRIDIIYSKDFDRIFIGLVKYIEASYVNTFEFQMNIIN